MGVARCIVLDILEVKLKIVFICPPNHGWEVEHAYGQLVIGMIEDGGDEIVCVIDQVHGSYHIHKLINKNSFDKFSWYNMERIESDEAFEAYQKAFFDAGLGIILDGMAYKFTGKLTV